MKKLLLLLIFVATFSVNQSRAQNVDTVLVHSNKMDKDVKNVIITPSYYDQSDTVTYPVLYLLHGYSGDYKQWIGIKPNLPQLASKYKMIIVCPDAQNSWYWDSPINPKSQYETYVTKELLSYVDSHYKTKTTPAGRAITGLSMGGQGGLFLGIRHQDLYGACGAMSGGVDIRPFPNNWEMSKQLGTYKANPQRWADYAVINQVNKIHSGKLKIIFDDGTEDFFYKVNASLHKKLLEMKIPHEYISRPGQHNSTYWHNAIDDQLVFFAKFFNTYTYK